MKWRKLPVIIEAEQHMGPEPLLIATLEGTMTAEPGDYIITGVEGERYPCKPGIFRKTYELADERVEPESHCTIALRECREQLADDARLIARLQLALGQAESERDTARSTAEALRNELSRDMTASSEKALAALQAKVARAVALWDASNKARGAQYQVAESEFYEAMDALR